MTETELIKGCINQERRAQKALYDRYKTQMYTLAYRITNDFERANDVLQEGFLDVFRGIEKFEGKAAIGTWIHTIILRRALKMIRNQITFDALEDASHVTAIDWGPQIDVEHLERAIQALPAGYRTIFTMIEIEGYKHREVAEALGISVGTSKAQLFKAKKKLREQLAYMIA